MSVSINTIKGGHYYFSREYRKAIVQLRETLQMDPDFALGHLWLGLSYEQEGSLDECVAALEIAHELDPKSKMIRASLGRAYAVSGKVENATWHNTLKDHITYHMAQNGPS